MAVIAPHPDDETLACGGVLALKARAGAEVHIVAMTLGEAAHDTCCGLDHGDVAEVRRGELLRAAGLLGVPRQNVHCLNLGDGAIPRAGSPGFDKAVAELRALFERIGPEEVFYPRWRDRWPDHEAASALTRAALGGKAAGYEYLVWGWWNGPQRLWREIFDGVKKVDIRAVMDRKAAAIAAYMEAPPAPCGAPYCGRLPRGFLDFARARYELFFSSQA
ncbi:MAG: PIG-L family deacetylase [Planctomycetota bacterium]